MMTKDKLRQLTGDERLGQMRESEYLGAEDIDDGTEPVLTIAGLWYGSVTLQRGKENKDVLSFKEERVPGILQVRPLIVNSTNRKTLRKLFGDAKASTLVGKQIQLYVDHNVRDPQDGGMTDGIRIRPYKPRVQKQEPGAALYGLRQSHRSGYGEKRSLAGGLYDQELRCAPMRSLCPEAQGSRGRCRNAAGDRKRCGSAAGQLA